MYCTTGFSRHELQELCALVVDVQAAVTEAERRTWPPILGLGGAVVVTLAYLRRNRVQAELAETYGVSQSTGSQHRRAHPGGERRRVLAPDGKTLRGAHVRAADGSVCLPHLVSVLDQASGAVLGQVQVQVQVREKGGEITAFTTLLNQLDLDEVLVTADALHTQRAHADYLHRRGGHYLMTIKANQPTLLARIRALPWAQIGVAARQRARGHGRVETRTISVVSLYPCPDPGGEFFPHATQAIKLVRRRRPLRSGGKRGAVNTATAFPQGGGW